MSRTKPAGGWRRLPLVLAATLALCSTVATAGPVVIGFAGGNNFQSFNGTNLTIGWEFTVASGAGITVTDLGWWDSTPADPLSQAHQVGIWTLSGALVGSATVQTNGSLVGDFRYASTTPFSLGGGTSYVIGGAIISPFFDFYRTTVTSLTVDPAVTFDGEAVSGSSSGFAAPLTINSTVDGRFGPNFQFISNAQAVPEPGTLWIAATALGLLAAVRLRGSKGTATAPRR